MPQGNRLCILYYVLVMDCVSLTGDSLHAHCCSVLYCSVLYKHHVWIVCLDYDVYIHKPIYLKFGAFIFKYKLSDVMQSTLTSSSFSLFSVRTCSVFR